MTLLYEDVIKTRHGFKPSLYHRGLDIKSFLKRFSISLYKKTVPTGKY